LAPPELAYRRQGSGPPLVVINGLAATSQDWDPAFIDGLAARNELFLIDNRGMGGSPDDGEPFSIADLAGDCARLIATHVEGPAVVLGWSLGGFIAQVLALEQPELVAKLVLLSTDHGGPEAEPGDPTVLDQLVDLAPSPQEQARRLLLLLFGQELGPSLYDQVGELVAAARAQLDPGLLERQRRAVEDWHRHGVAARLRAISAPTLIAAGTADQVIPPSNALRLAQHIPDAWLLRFRGGGHAFMAQYPSTLSGVIGEFAVL